MDWRRRSMNPGRSLDMLVAEKVMGLNARIVRTYDALAEIQKEIDRIHAKIAENTKLMAAPNIRIFNDDCEHEYKQYLGLSESYEYCMKCDAKKSG